MGCLVWIWSYLLWTHHHVCIMAEGGECGGLNASSFDGIWRLKRHTDRSPNSCCSDSWASMPNGACAWVCVFVVRKRRELKLGLKWQRKWYRKLKKTKLRRSEGSCFPWLLDLRRSHLGIEGWTTTLERERGWNAQEERSEMQWKCVQLCPGCRRVLSYRRLTSKGRTKYEEHEWREQSLTFLLLTGAVIWWKTWDCLTHTHASAQARSLPLSLTHTHTHTQSSQQCLYSYIHSVLLELRSNVVCVWLSWQEISCLRSSLLQRMWNYTLLLSPATHLRTHSCSHAETFFFFL